MARKKTLTKRKTRLILHEGKVRGHKLTGKQRRYMGARASGLPVKRTKTVSKRKRKR